MFNHKGKSEKQIDQEENISISECEHLDLKPQHANFQNWDFVPHHLISSKPEKFLSDEFEVRIKHT
jgi:hypothetical protein